MEAVHSNICLRELQQKRKTGVQRTDCISYICGYGHSMDFQDDANDGRQQLALCFGFSFAAKAALTKKGFHSYISFGAGTAQFPAKMPFWNRMAPRPPLA